MKAAPLTVALFVTLVAAVGCKDKNVEVDTSKAKAMASAPSAATATATPPATAATTKAAPAAGGATAGAGSCMHGDKSLCLDYVGLSSMEAGEEKADCEKEGGKWASAPCAALNALGTCSNPAGGTTKIKLYKGADFKTANEAKKAMCSDKGDAFVATP
jgi:hypothetical protein